MLARRFRFSVGALLAVAGLAPVVALAQIGVAHSTKKGSLLYFSKVELRWDAAGNLIQDTFLDVTNDFTSNVLVQFYYVNGDPALPFDPGTGERAHPGCNNVDYRTTITMNQPTYWSLATGKPRGAQKFTVLDPSSDPLKQGRPDPEGSTDRVLRGFVLGWAVDSLEREIHWNHLKGEALLINYQTDSAWEYNAWAFQAVTTPGNAGDLLLAPYGQLDLNGTEYNRAPARLLLDFYADGGEAFQTIGASAEVFTDLTLHPASVDLRQDGEGPVCTKAEFAVWDQNEDELSSATQCICCWDQRFISDIEDTGSIFEFGNGIETFKGKARIDGVFSTQCPDAEAAALLGVAAKRIVFTSGFNVGDEVWTGMNLHITTTESGAHQNAVVYYDRPEGPGEFNNPSRRPDLSNPNLP